MLITVLLPSLNEEGGIVNTLEAIPRKKLRKMGYEVEVLVVDGGSRDRTREVARKKKAKVLITEPGYGFQYRYGFKRVKGRIIVTADSDGSYPMEEIPKYIKILEDEKLEFISTNRFARMGRGSMRKINLVGNWLLTLFTNLLFGLRLKDSQSGMWVMRRSALDKLRLTSSGMALSEEIKIEAFKNLKAKEVPSSYSKRVGRVKLKILQDGMENFLFLFKKRFLME